MNRAMISGTGMYVPEKVMTNDDLSKFVDTNDEWITKRTGISERRIAASHETTAYMASKAALEALKNSGTEAMDIDLIITSTFTPDYAMPSVSCLVQKDIEAINAACFDVSAACSGFVYALNIAYNFISSGQYKKVLVIGAEKISKVLNWEDRATCVLFGDGAGAVVLESRDNEEISEMRFCLGADGTGYEALKCEQYIEMNGKEVFKFAVRTVEESIRNIVEAEGININDISLIIPHQANYRIIEAVAKKLELPLDKFYLNLKQYANTSAATIPIALHEAYISGKLHKGDKVILVGFGGGLTWGVTLLEWNI